MLLFGNGSEVCASFQDRFRVKKKIWLRKYLCRWNSLIKINSQNWWLWIAYEHLISIPTWVCTSFKRKNYFYLLSVLQTDKRKVWKETDLYWWCAQWYIDACKWLRLKHIVYGTELEYYRKIHPADQRQNRMLWTMMIFPVSWMQYAACLELVKDVSSLSTYGNRQNQVHKFLDKIQLS